MKKALFAAGLGICLASTPVLAGSVADPIVEPPVIVEDVKSSSSSGGTIVALMALLLLGVPMGK